MNTNGFSNLLAFLNKLEQEKINYTLAHHREESIMVLVAVPGQRWEIEFLEDGAVEVEKFISTGEITGRESFNELFTKFADQEDNVHSSEQTANTTVVGKVA